MDMTDEELLDFDKSELAEWRPDAAAEALAGNDGAIYRNHLAIAKWIDGWVEQMHERASGTSDFKPDEGYIRGVQSIAAYLRQTDLMPGGRALKP